MMEEEFLKILSCPRCGGAVSLDENKANILCSACSLLFEIKDGIPIMLLSKARYAA